MKTVSDINKRIACVIVTYNRKQLLKRCIEAVSTQSYKPTTVFIVDNASTDGTLESVKEWGYYESVRDGIRYKYVLNSKNEGGSGGFYRGMKIAYEEKKYDAYWLMDDDGEPECNCLFFLCQHLNSIHHYVAPIVLSDDDHHSCSFARNYEDVELFARIKGAEGNIIRNWASPFNGVLYSNELVSKVGFPKKEMFIWGDEINYQLRCIKSGYIPITVLNSVHYHPLNRQEYTKFLGRAVVSNITADWKLYCYLRNTIYNSVYVGPYFPKNIYVTIRFAISIIVFYQRQGRSLHLLLSAMVAGCLGYFKGLNRFFPDYHL